MNGAPGGGGGAGGGDWGMGAALPTALVLMLTVGVVILFVRLLLKLAWGGVMLALAGWSVYEAGRVRRHVAPSGRAYYRRG